MVHGPGTSGPTPVAGERDGWQVADARRWNRRTAIGASPRSNGSRELWDGEGAVLLLAVPRWRSPARARTEGATRTGVRPVTPGGGGAGGSGAGEGETRRKTYAAKEVQRFSFSLSPCLLSPPLKTKQQCGRPPTAHLSAAPSWQAPWMLPWPSPLERVVVAGGVDNQAGGSWGGAAWRWVLTGSAAALRALAATLGGGWR